MKDLIANFPEQLVKAVDIANNVKFNYPKYEIRNIFISGLGGSGIGGTIAKEIVEKSCPVPIIVNKDYHCPSFINSHTLAIICSYSGNTEETISVLETCITHGAQIVCISSGGKISEIAQKLGLTLITIPGGMPPRSCLGYSLTQILKTINYYTIPEANFPDDILSAAKLLHEAQESIISATKELASKIYDKIPVIYSLGSTEGVSIRLRQQLNENAKMLCWHHVLPEMNHNELVGWTQENHHLAVLVYRYSFDFQRTIKRLEISREIFKKFTPYYFEIATKGDSVLQEFVYAIHYGDWLSWFISDIKKVDAMDIKVIDYLKSTLEKV
jgi:glucose/mannose-6-phosphate isomerase